MDMFHRQTFIVLLKSAVFICCLLLFLVVYLQDIVDKYRHEDTTFSLKKVPNKNPTIPAITFCPLNPYKIDAVQNGTGRYEGIGAFMHNRPLLKNISLPAFFNEAAFILNRDYIAYYQTSSSKKLLVLGENEIGDSILSVDEIPVPNTRGMCYGLRFLVNPKVKGNGEFGRLLIFPNTTQDMENRENHPQGIIFYISTESTTLNVATDTGEWNWTPVKPLIIRKKFAYRYRMYVYIEETVWQFHKGDPNCEEGCSPKDCYIKHFSSELEELACLPIQVRALVPIANLSSCLTPEENGFMLGKILQKAYGITCPLPASDVEFNAVVDDDERFDMVDPKDVIEARFYHKSAFKTMKKEVLIYDTPTLIGTIGGFLGLFIGFSFFDFVSLIIDKLDKLSH